MPLKMIGIRSNGPSYGRNKLSEAVIASTPNLCLGLNQLRRETTPKINGMPKCKTSL